MSIVTHMAGIQMDGEVWGVHRNRDVATPSMTSVDPRRQSETTHMSHMWKASIVKPCKVHKNNNDIAFLGGGKCVAWLWTTLEINVGHLCEYRRYLHINEMCTYIYVKICVYNMFFTIPHILRDSIYVYTYSIYMYTHILYIFKADRLAAGCSRAAAALFQANSHFFWAQLQREWGQSSSKEVCHNRVYYMVSVAYVK